MRDTRLIECSGWTGEGETRREIEREFRVYRSLAPLVIGVHRLLNFADVATAAVAARANGKAMRQMIKSKVDLESATEQLCNEKVGDSAFVTLKKAFKLAYDGVRNSVAKFDEANKEADKVAAEIEAATEKAAGRVDPDDGDDDDGEEKSVELVGVIPADVEVDDTMPEDIDDDDDENGDEGEAE
jgi:hypothetical protein